MNGTDIVHIRHQGRDIAMVIPAGYKSQGVNFLTPAKYSQQVACMGRPKGYTIEPHTHNLVERRVEYTQEALFIRKGRVRVDLYTEDKIFLQSLELETGDVIFLCSGGHGFTVLEDLDFVEIKQGPYAGEDDKTIFASAVSVQSCPSDAT